MGKEQFMKKHQGQIIPFVREAEYYFNKGLKAYRHSDIYRAQKFFQRAVQMEPEEPVYVCQLATIESELGNFRLSNQLLTKVMEELDPNMPECLYLIANNYAHLGLFNQAEKHIKKYLEEDPDGEFLDDAVELLELLSIENEEEGMLANDDDELIMKQEEAKQHLESGKFHAAIKLLKEIIADYPEYWSSYNNLSLAYFYSGDNENAFGTLREVLEKDPGNLHAMCNLAVFSLYLGKEAETESFINQLKNIYPIDVDHRFKLGATFALVGEYNDAYKWLKWLYKHGFEGDGSFYYWLALSAYETGRQAFAEAIWGKLVDVNPAKKGMEPWNKEQIADVENRISKMKLSDLKDNFAFRSTMIHTIHTNQEMELKLYAAFMLSELGDEESYEVLKQSYEMEAENEDVKEFTAYMMARIKPDHHLSESRGVLAMDGKGSPVYHGVKVTTMLKSVIHEKVTLDKAHELFSIWFHVYADLLKEGTVPRNEKAWVAAVEYVWKKANEQKITQSDLAEKYEVSVATVRKYVQFVKTRLT